MTRQRQKRDTTLIRIPWSMFGDMRIIAVEKGMRLQEVAAEAFSDYLQANHEFINKEISLSL